MKINRMLMYSLLSFVSVNLRRETSLEAFQSVAKYEFVELICSMKMEQACIDKLIHCRHLLL